MGRIMQYLLFRDCFISLSIMSSSFIHVAVCSITGKLFYNVYVGLGGGPRDTDAAGP